MLIDNNLVWRPVTGGYRGIHDRLIEIGTNPPPDSSGASADAGVTKRSVGPDIGTGRLTEVRMPGRRAASAAALHAGQAGQKADSTRSATPDGDSTAL